MFAINGLARDDLMFGARGYLIISNLMSPVPPPLNSGMLQSFSRIG
jgi:hypothetical protein